MLKLEKKNNSVVVVDGNDTIVSLLNQYHNVFLMKKDDEEYLCVDNIPFFILKGYALYKRYFRSVEHIREFDSPNRDETGKLHWRLAKATETSRFIVNNEHLMRIYAHVSDKKAGNVRPLMRQNAMLHDAAYAIWQGVLSTDKNINLKKFAQKANISLNKATELDDHWRRVHGYPRRERLTGLGISSAEARSIFKRFIK